MNLLPPAPPLTEQTILLIESLEMKIGACLMPQQRQYFISAAIAIAERIEVAKQKRRRRDEIAERLSSGREERMTYEEK